MVINVPDLSDELTEKVICNALEKAENNSTESDRPFYVITPVSGCLRFVRCWFCGDVCCVPFATPDIPHRPLFGTCCNCADEGRHFPTADDNDAHVHDFSLYGVCSICGEIKYKSLAYCEIYGCDPD